MLLSTLIAGVFAFGAVAVPYTEKGSGITFSARVDPKVTFGVVLSTTSTTDFIGLIIGQGTGWTGISLGGPMTQNALLIAAWPNNNTLLASFRKTAYDHPNIHVPRSGFNTNLHIQHLRKSSSRQRNLCHVPYRKRHIYKLHPFHIHLPLFQMHIN